MSPKFNLFTDAADAMIVNSADKCAVISSALALALSTIQPLPTTQVDNPHNYYSMNLLQGIKAIVSEWNEGIIFDAQDTLQQTVMFWLIRYTAAYPNSRVFFSFTNDFFDTITGVYAFVPKKLHEFLDGPNKASIINLSNVAIATIQSNSVTTAQ